MTWQGQVKLWLLVVLTIPSSIFSILIFIYFYRQRKNLSIHHHLTLILTALNFVQVVTDFPFVIIYYIRGEVFSPTNAFCLWWTWWDYSLSCVLVFVMAWGCVERHFLIFYSSAFATPRKRFFFHTVPMFLACIYPLIFYLMTIALNTCENQWDYETVSSAYLRSEGCLRIFLVLSSQLLCLQPCYLSDQPALATFDFFMNYAFPIITMTLANGSLIGRICWQKRHWRNTLQRQRKLTIQLSSVALLYIVFWTPLTVTGLMYTFTLSPELPELQGDYFFFLPYMVDMFIPFISLPLLPDFRKVLLGKRHAPVLPLNTVTNAQTINVKPRSHQKWTMNSAYDFDWSLL